MSKEETQAYIAGLLEERRGYEIHGNKEGLAGVDAELKRVGYQAKAPRERATKLDAKKRRG